MSPRGARTILPPVGKAHILRIHACTWLCRSCCRCLYCTRLCLHAEPQATPAVVSTGASSTALARSAEGETCTASNICNQCPMRLLNRLRLDPAKHRLSTTTRSVGLPRAGALAVRSSVRPQPKLPRSPKGEHTYINTEDCCIAGGRDSYVSASRRLGVRGPKSGICDGRCSPACLLPRESRWHRLRRKLLGY